MHPLRFAILTLAGCSILTIKDEPSGGGGRGEGVLDVMVTEDAVEGETGLDVHFSVTARSGDAEDEANVFAFNEPVPLTVPAGEVDVYAEGSWAHASAEETGGYGAYDCEGSATVTLEADSIESVSVEVSCASEWSD